MRKLGKTIFQVLVCLGLSIVATLSFAKSSKDVIVTNTVPVMNVENPDKLPIVLPEPLLRTLTDGQNNINSTMATVPTGKRWIIEHVSAFAEHVPAGQIPKLAIMIGNDLVHMLSFSSQGESFYVISQPLKLRLSAGEMLRFNIGRSGTAGSLNMGIYVSGYEIEYP